MAFLYNISQRSGVFCSKANIRNNFFCKSRQKRKIYNRQCAKTHAKTKKMKLNNIAGQKNIDAFVDYKIKLLEQSDKSMEALFNLMFSERDNVFFEQSQGIKTTKITYGQAYDKIQSLAGDLQRKVCAEPQSVVGLYMQNSADWIVAFWTIVRAGFKPLLLNTRFYDSTVEQVLRQAKAV